MLNVMYHDDELLTIGYVGLINSEVGDALFDGLFEGEIGFPNGESRQYDGEGHAIFINERCRINGEFAGLVKFKVYQTESEVPALAKQTIDHLFRQEQAAKEADNV